LHNQNVLNSDAKQDSGRKLFYGLFVFPLLIAVGMAVLLCAVVLLTREAETPGSLIAQIKTGSPSKRWQKAFELSNELNQGRGMIRESGVMNEVIHILNARGEYDAKTRSYMALALSRFNEPEARQALLGTLREETESETQLYLMWALGIRGVREAADAIEPFTRSPNEDLRKMSAYVLGVLGGEKNTRAVEPLLKDPSRDVRWNAALALARLGNDGGYKILIQMTDRKMLAGYEGLSEGKVEEIMVNAIKGLGFLHHKGESLPILAGIAHSDKSLKVRQAAMEVLNRQRAPVAA